MRNEVFHFDLYGKREVKYEFLNQGNITSIPWIRLKLSGTILFFCAEGICKPIIV